MLSVGNPSPAPEEVATARDEAGMTQEQAAAVVHATREAWKSWESGRRKIPLAAWELFHLKIGRKDPVWPSYEDQIRKPGDPWPPTVPVVPTKRK